MSKQSIDTCRPSESFRRRAASIAEVDEDVRAPEDGWFVDAAGGELEAAPARRMAPALREV
jgi:hypothetical protein